MPWSCPKCGLHLGQETPDTRLPEPDIVRRCPVCHLLVRFDPVTKKMVPVPPSAA
jgi:hypothetical protein